jgi:hypothetical protein
MIARYVDDLLIAGCTKNLVTKLEATFKSKYKIKKLYVIKALHGVGILHDNARNTIYIT